MPAKPRWWRHIAEIRSMLDDTRLPVIDRASVERLFGLERRQAIELMHRFGGYQAGRTFLIGREQLIGELDSIASTGEYQQEAARRERLVASMEAVRRTRRTEAVRIPVSPEVFDSRIQSLEPAVQLTAGKLAIEFAGPEDLLGKLFALAQAVANDYAAFEHAATGAGGGASGSPAETPSTGETSTEAGGRGLSAPQSAA
jgi:hypothetical protein